MLLWKHIVLSEKRVLDKDYIRNCMCLFSSVLLFEGFCHGLLAKAANFLNPLLSWLLGLLCPFNTARRRGKNIIT